MCDSVLVHFIHPKSKSFLCMKNFFLNQINNSYVSENNGQIMEATNSIIFSHTTAKNKQYFSTLSLSVFTNDG